MILLIIFSLLIKQVTDVKLLYYECILKFLLLLVEVILLCLFYMIYVMPLPPLIMINCFVYLRNLWKFSKSNCSNRHRRNIYGIHKNFSFDLSLILHRADCT